MPRIVLLAASGAIAFVIFMIAFRGPTEAGVEKAMVSKYGYQSAQCEVQAVLVGNAVFDCVVVRSRGPSSSAATLTRCYSVSADNPSNQGRLIPCPPQPGSPSRQ